VIWGSVFRLMKPAFVSTIVNRVTGGRVKYGWYNNRFRSPSWPVFIGGCDRSGTTLVYSLLNAHSRLFIGLETALTGANSNIRHLAGRTGLPAEELKMMYKQSCCYPEFAECVLSSLMRQHGKQRWGDKSPGNVTRIESTFRYFPNARFIHVIRDGRDVVSSLRTHLPTLKRSRPAGEKFNDWKASISYWEEYVRSGMAWREDPRYYEIKYESLVNNPEAELKMLFDWLGEPWEEEILLNARNMHVSSHPDVSRPIHPKGIGRWQNDLSGEARKLFYESANALLIELGYAKNREWMEAV